MEKGASHSSEDDGNASNPDSNASSPGSNVSGQDANTRPTNDKNNRTHKIASVLTKLLDQTDTTRPILSKKKHIEKELDDVKLSEKAKKLISARKRIKFDSAHVIPDHSTMDYEKSLRKTATHGVVELFNALAAAQKTAQQIASEGVQKNEISASKESKKAFLKSIQSAQPKPATFLEDDFALDNPKVWHENEEEEDAQVF